MIQDLRCLVLRFTILRQRSGVKVLEFRDKEKGYRVYGS